MAAPKLGYGKRRLITEIIKKTWETENPEQVKLSYNDVLYVLQELEDEEGKKYLEEDYSMKRGHHIFKKFTEQLLYRNVANYDSMVLMTSEKGCITGDALLEIPNSPYKIKLEDVVNKGPIKVKSYNIKTKQFETKISDGVEYVKTCSVVELQLENGQKLTGTPDHPMLTNKGTYKKIIELTKKDYIITTNGEQKVKDVINRGINHVYDVVNVQDNHNFIVNGFVSSNTGKSSSSIMLARYWCKLIGIRFDPNRHMAYNNQDVMNKIKELRNFEPMICDEAVRFACLDGETEIYTRKGTIKIKDLVGEKNFEVLSYDEKKESYSYKKAEKCIPTKKDYIFELETECGKKIKCTKEHKFLTKDGWKELQELKEGDDLIGC